MHRIKKWTVGVLTVGVMVCHTPLWASGWIPWGLLGYEEQNTGAASSVPVPVSPSRDNDTSSSLNMDMTTQLPKSATPPPGFIPVGDDMFFVQVNSPPKPDSDAPHPHFYGDPEALRRLLAQNRPATPPTQGGLWEAMHTPFVGVSSTSSSHPTSSSSSLAEDAQGLFDVEEDASPPFPEGFLVHGTPQDILALRTRTPSPPPYYIILAAKKSLGAPMVFVTSEVFWDFLDETTSGGSESLDQLLINYTLPQGLEIWMEHRLILLHEFTSQGLVGYLWKSTVMQRVQAIEDLATFEVARAMELSIYMPAEIFEARLHEAKRLYRTHVVESLPVSSQIALPSENVYMDLSGKAFLVLVKHVKECPAIPSSALFSSPVSPVPEVQLLEAAAHTPLPVGLLTGPSHPNVVELEDDKDTRVPASQGWQPAPELVTAGMVGLTAAAFYFFGKFGK